MLFARITWRGLHASSCSLLSFDCFSQQTLISVRVANLNLTADGVLSLKLPWRRLILQKPARDVLEEMEGPVTLLQGCRETYRAIAARGFDIPTSWVP